MGLCILSPIEAQGIASGNAAAIDSLKTEVCSGLNLPKAELQSKFKEVVGSNPRAIAYLWRGNSVEAVEADSKPNIEPCQKTSTPERCEALVASYQGELSRRTAEFEEKILGKKSCDWRAEADKQDASWLSYFEKNKELLDDPLALIKSFMGYSEAFLSDPSLSEEVPKLLATWVLVSRFLSGELKPSGYDSTMRDLFCFKKDHAMSARILDLLQKTKVQGMERVKIVYSSTGLNFRITLKDDSFVYLTKSGFFSTKVYYDGDNDVMPAWQSLAINFTNLGTLLLEKGNPNKAINVFQKALAMNPQFKKARINLGFALEKKEKLNGKVMQKSPKVNEQLENAKRLCPLFKAQKNWDKTLIECFYVVATDSQDITAHINLGIALGETGNFVLAITEFRQALKIDPQNLEAHLYLGAALAHQGDLDAAITEYQKAIRINPADPRIKEILEMLIQRRDKSR